MAIQRLTPVGVNSILDAELLNADFTGEGVFQEVTMGMDKLENGQIVTISKKVAGTPTAVGDKVYLHYSEPEIYESYLGKETWAKVKGKGSDARFFVLKDGDIIATNAAVFDTTDFADLTALKVALKAGQVYAVPYAGLDWKLVKAAGITGAKVVAEAEEATLSNERFGVRLYIK